MYFIQTFVLALCITLSPSSLSVHKTGWLDRLVQYYKHSFYDDVKRLVPVDVNATIQKAPPGYMDSPNWTFETVSNLLVLISQSETSRPVFQKLRRMLGPTRRIMMSRYNSFKNFPSLSKYIINDIYYDTESEEDQHTEPPLIIEQPKYIEEDFPTMDAVIVISNPVEARLPSAQISINLLKDILDARAMAGRIMPSSTKSTIHWVTTTNNNSTVAENATTTAGADGAATSPGPDASPSSAGADETSTGSQDGLPTGDQTTPTQ
ncbi:hypothetical protein K1T71_001014 [Dendrolimus kikuchii]|uniref:Uncharacterized protein n=1 Tax=Dendrolimus kikuchii TaxID=765133 RepID=A0ACC1DGG2_9NEOP|nr:hypothetical protein K1T71_001014 [Dendrolimus kikuchii]